MRKYKPEGWLILLVAAFLLTCLIAGIIHTAYNFKPNAEAILARQAAMQSELDIMQSELTKISEAVESWPGITEIPDETIPKLADPFSRSRSEILERPPTIPTVMLITTPTPSPAPVRKSLGMFTVVAYCQGGNGLLTATGATCKAGRTVAVDPKVIPYGTRIYIDGIGERIAEDCGGFRGKVVDVYFKTAAECWDWGKRQREVWIIEEGERE
jgi:3D (Asp-Asp-Asp) domain-containing protein